MTQRLIVGLAMTAVAFGSSGRRLHMLYRLGRAGQPVRAPVADTSTSATARHPEGNLP